MMMSALLPSFNKCQLLKTEPTQATITPPFALTRV